MMERAVSPEGAPTVTPDSLVEQVERMPTRVQRRARVFLALLFALGFAFSVTAASPLEASALPKRGSTAESVCYWGGMAYSYGAVVVSNGRKYECRNGSWVDIGYAEVAS